MRWSCRYGSSHHSAPHFAPRPGIQWLSAKGQRGVRLCWRDRAGWPSAQDARYPYLLSIVPSPAEPADPPSHRPTDPRPQTVASDDEAKLGQLRDPAPRWLGNVLAWLLNLIGPKVGGTGWRRGKGGARD